MPREVQKPVAELSDDELIDELREQVTLARNTHGKHDRARTRAISEEAHKRGFGVRQTKQ